ncbi:uncharacterized protein PRCAT00006297001 [Priceomyces carsonii]|uniref:uncharacterized protein n=1 Tax=Priceomyces carsonii TaxID=28549 RepID=UPI002EDA996B|nr:unnamed protein product [Priceomyces carsonii]
MSCEHEHHHGPSGGHGHDHGDDGRVPPVPTSVAQSLHGKIDLPHVTALNVENPPDEVLKIFRNSSQRYELKPVIKSDSDEQVIFHIPFINSSVKLHSLVLRTNGSKYCPKTIKLFKNDRTVDFDNAESKVATFTISHPQVGVLYDNDDDELPDTIEQDSDFVEHHLPRHKFTGVQHLTLFVESVHGEEDQSRFHYIDLRGEFTELTKDPVIAIYELAANPADHKNVLQESVNFSVGN